MTTTAKSTSADDEGPLTPSIVYIIDDDEDVRVSLGSLLRLVGHRVQVFSSPVEFLTLPRESIPSFHCHVAEAMRIVDAQRARCS